MTTIIKRRFALSFTPLVLQVILHCVGYQSNLSGTAQAQNIGVNATGATPNASSILDLNTGNNFTNPNGKGILPPSVALTGITDAATVASPATSLLVYNSAAVGTGTAAVVPGYYYWDGAKWVRLQTAAGASQNWSLLGNAGTTAGSNFLGTTDAQDLVFKTNGIENGRILNSNGNVGIGTATPSAKLHVGGGNRYTVADIGSILLQSGTGGTGAARDWKIYVPMTAGYLSFRDMGFDNLNNGMTNDAMVIQWGTGNVGINNAAPTTKLSIVATTTNTGFQLQDGSEGVGNVLTSDANGKAIWDDPTRNTYDLSSNILGPITTTAFTLGNTITLAKGVYYVQPYNLITSVVYSNAYYANISAVASSGSIISNSINRDFTFFATVNGYYTMPGFIVKVTSPTANVALKLMHGNGGTFSVPSSVDGLLGSFTKIN